MLKIAIYICFFIFFYFPAYNSPITSSVDFTDSRTIITMLVISFIRVSFSLLMIYPASVDSFKRKYLLHIALLTFLLLLLSYGVNFMLSLFHPTQTVEYYHDSITTMLVIMLMIGYDEEFFFRMTPFHIVQKYRSQAVLVTNILFTIAHSSQGFYSIIISAILGSLLSIIYIRYRNIHLNALSHGLYNFLVLLLN